MLTEISSHVYKRFREVKFTESREVVARSRESGDRNCLMNTEFQFCKMKKVLELFLEKKNVVIFK